MEKLALTSIRREVLSVPQRRLCLAVFAIDTLVIVLLLKFKAGSLAFIAPILFFHAFAIMHECVHHNGSSNSFINAILGEVAGALCLMPYQSYKHGHLTHHQWAGNLHHDPVLQKIYHTFKHPSPLTTLLNFSWRTWIPFLAFGQTLYLWISPIVSRSQRYAQLRSVCLSALLWGVLVHQGLSLTALLLSYSVFLVLMELVSFPHHYAVHYLFSDERLPTHEQHQVTRSCYFPPLISGTLFLNFNFHTEHHLFPTLPWQFLPRVRSRLMPLLGKHYLESHGFEWDIQARCQPMGDVTGFTAAEREEECFKQAA